MQKFTTSHERDTEFIRLWNLDWTAKRISQRLNINPTSVYAIANRLKLPKRGNRTKIMRSAR